MCHICLTNKSKHMIKCKLCCDGLEQDCCAICANLYNAYKATYATDRAKASEYFGRLKAMRAQGIKNIKELQDYTIGDKRG